MKEKLLKLHSWFDKKMTESICLMRYKGEEKIREEATNLSYRNVGLGGIKEANFLTPCPWLYEKSLKRKLLWIACSLLGKIVKRNTYILPLKADDYVKGKWIVFHSGISILRCKEGETVTCSQAYFDPYPNYD